MTQIDYGRLNAIEAALGGRAAIQAAYEAQQTLTGGSGGSGNVIVRKFPFAFDTPDLLTGAALYTPTVGDLLVDAWVEIITAWNGTTPQGDLGTFVGTTQGFFAFIAGGGGFNMAVPSAESVGAGILMGGSPSLVEANAGNGITYETNAVPAIGAVPSPQLNLTNRFAAAWQNAVSVLGRFTAANPFRVVVSQDGTAGGADPGSTQGAAVLYLVTATAV